MTMTQDKRDQLQNDYIESIIDGMDHKDLWQFVYDTMEQNLETYSDEELVTEVKDYYPHLLEPSIITYQLHNQEQLLPDH